MKECKKCNILKSFDFFNKRSDSPDGYRGECKECKSKYDASLKERERIEVLEKECSKCENIKPLDDFHKLASSRDGHRTMCKVCSLEYSKNYIPPPEVEIRMKERQRKYARRPNVKKRLNEKQKKRYETDICFKLRLLVSNSVNKSIKKQNHRKNGSILKYLPYTISELKEHLESQFDETMTWENHGDYWHIDHIYPQSLLPYDSFIHPNFIKCWNLENLQPLSAFENLQKGNKIMDNYLFLED